MLFGLRLIALLALLLVRVSTSEAQELRRIHYGTTTSPIYYGAGYTTPGAWWLDGFLLATLNTVVWLVVGAVWWKVLGWW